MFCTRVTSTICSASRSAAAAQGLRGFASVSPATHAVKNHRVVVIGAGTAGLTVSHQLLRTGKFKQDEIAVVDPSEWHHYQAGWTLVGGGLKTKEQLRTRLSELIDPKLKLYNQGVSSLNPENNSISLENGDKVAYEQLVVTPGISVNYNSIKGLPEALANPDAPVCSIYDYKYCDKVYPNIQKLKKGTAIFSQPAGVIKCAGAPQKIMWLALDYWKSQGRYNLTEKSPIKISFATGLPVMFGVPKYSAKLEELRTERGVEGIFKHDLQSIDGNTATFASADDNTPVKRKFDMMHVVPKMGGHSFVKNSALANDAGFVDVNEGTLQHKKYKNVWSCGDAAGLPTSKTTAAITAQAPVLVGNMMQAIEDKAPQVLYDGYTSCPLTTEYGKVLLAEFKYGPEPKETFGNILGIDQSVPRRAFYHLKKDFFPWVYKKYMVKGKWAGPKGWNLK